MLHGFKSFISVIVTLVGNSLPIFSLFFIFKKAYLETSFYHISCAMFKERAFLAIVSVALLSDCLVPSLKYTLLGNSLWFQESWVEYWLCDPTWNVAW